MKGRTKTRKNLAGLVQQVGRNLIGAHCPALVSRKRCWSSVALMELGVKPGEVGMVSGIPEQHLKRRVLIYSPARTASQQGSGKVGKWKINSLSTQKNFQSIVVVRTKKKYYNMRVGKSVEWVGHQQEIRMPMLVRLDLNLIVKKLQKHSLRNMAGNMKYVKKRHTPLLKVKSYADNFKWKGPPNGEDDYP
ncbi:NADH-ubiquinone oxidoreductase-related-like protein [Theobroma cacao]|uniref:NADH-ubiquinone oxidoreductase-related-like protein n=1 Tax=Theobroma cacao TaxID=3641 RepID=A0A061FFA0_THECC|nr:NADH-ubiquinone oxidoreductase-related-like protein [Theobroma cacao]